MAQTDSLLDAGPVFEAFCSPSARPSVAQSLRRSVAQSVRRSVALHPFDAHESGDKKHADGTAGLQRDSFQEVPRNPHPLDPGVQTQYTAHKTNVDTQMHAIQKAFLDESCKGTSVETVELPRLVTHITQNRKCPPRVYSNNPNLCLCRLFSNHKAFVSSQKTT